MLFKAVFLASALAALATAQNATATSASITGALSTQSQSMPAVATAGFNIGNTTMTERSQWCLAQTNNCRFICGGTTSTDTCDPSTLSYSCICPNGTVPDVSAFIDTVPFYICQTTYDQCIANHPMDQVGQQVCTNNEKCGTRNATAEYSSSALAAGGASATSTGASRSSGASSSATSAAASASSSAAAKSDSSITTYTSGAFVMVLMAAFKLIL